MFFTFKKIVQGSFLMQFFKKKTKKYACHINMSGWDQLILPIKLVTEESLSALGSSRSQLPTASGTPRSAHSFQFDVEAPPASPLK